MATQAALRARIRDNLYASVPVEHPPVHQINGAINDSTTTVVVDDGTLLAVNDVIEFFDGEQCLVLGISTNTLTVVREYNGTTAASHSDNDPFYMRPKFTIKQIDDSITETLLDLEKHGVYTWGTGSVTLVADQLYYDLTATDIEESIGVVAVYYADSTTDVPVPLPFRWLRGLHATVSTSGHGLHLWTWGDKSAGDSVYYTYAQLIDGVADIPTRVEDVVVKGATSRVMDKAIAPRFVDPGQYSDRTVQPGSVMRDARWWLAQYIMACQAEQAQLKVEARRFPGTVETKRAMRFVR